MSPKYVEESVQRINTLMGKLSDSIRENRTVDAAQVLGDLYEIHGFAYTVQDEMETKEAAQQLAEEEESDAVNHPDHYKVGGIETIDFIEAKQLSYHLGNVVKYVSRAGHKSDDALQDLRKAAWYLQREIDNRALAQETA